MVLKACVTCASEPHVCSRLQLPDRMWSAYVCVLHTRVAMGNFSFASSVNLWSVRMAGYGAQLTPKVTVLNL